MKKPFVLLLLVLGLLLGVVSMVSAVDVAQNAPAAATMAVADLAPTADLTIAEKATMGSSEQVGANSRPESVLRLAIGLAVCVFTFYAISLWFVPRKRTDVTQPLNRARRQEVRSFLGSGQRAAQADA